MLQLGSKEVLVWSYSSPCASKQQHSEIESVWESCGPMEAVDSLTELGSRIIQWEGVQVYRARKSVWPWRKVPVRLVGGCWWQKDAGECTPHRGSLALRREHLDDNAWLVVQGIKHALSRAMLAFCFLLGLLLNPKYRSDVFLRNVG